MRLFVDNLINIDFSYLDPERGLVGETWMAHIELQGGLDEQGMVCDFGIVKKTLRDWLNNELDHKLLVPTASTNLQLQHQQGQVSLEWGFDGQQLSCASPDEAVALVTADTISSHTVADWCISQLQSVFPDTIEQMSLYFSSEHTDEPSYHYSHGLKKHSGNCQRIAHGHRSIIKIWRNGQLCEKAMGQWATRFHDIYIGTREDVAETTEEHHVFAYDAPQGRFQLKLPKNRCYLMDSDTTVELIAQHIAQTLAAESPRDEFVVKAFEGIGKGAIADSYQDCQALVE
jgi:6-pyruvoyl-tetrahydropterin synthase